MITATATIIIIIIMTMHKALHTRDDVDRLYVSRKKEEEDLPALKTA